MSKRVKSTKPKKKNGPGSGNSIVTRAESSASSQPQYILPPLDVLLNDGMPFGFKRISLPDLDFGETAPPVKRSMESNSPVVVAGVKSGPGVVKGGHTVATSELTTDIKEIRFRNMLKMFPEISLLLLKNTLVKHGWNEELSRDELLKYDPEMNDRSSSSPSSTGSRPGFSDQVSRPNGGSIVRVNSKPKGVVARKPLAAQGGRARRGRTRKGKDDRV